MNQSQGGPHTASNRRHAELSRDLGSLIRAIHTPDTNKGEDKDFGPDPITGEHCDVLIVGSGYGGAISAAALAQASKHSDQEGKHLDAPARIWLLERGKEYLPGQFPDRFAELPRHVRFNTPKASITKGARDGLFDMRISHDVSALVASGLGGGSLINAGVMLWPQDEVGQHARWPKAIQQAWPDLKVNANRVQEALGAIRPDKQLNTVDLAAPPPKFNVLQQLARADAFQAVPLTVALQAHTETSDGIQLQQCIGCGDCATGCNHNAKISLDTNLLARAARLGVRMFTGATVTHLERAGDSGGWKVSVHHTERQMRESQSAPLVIHARRVILAAGAFGSTEILMRARESGLPVSLEIGKHCSANGDLVAMSYDQASPVHAFARADVKPDARKVGPTITGMIDLRSSDAAATPHVIQDMAVPASLQRLVEELFTTAHALHGLSQSDNSRHTETEAFTDPMAIDDDLIDRSSLLAVIGHDDASGEMVLGTDDPGNQEPCDGALTLRWPNLKADARLDAQIAALQSRCDGSQARGQVIPNPAWRPLPASSEFLLDNQRGSLLTVHPLGGCNMADSVREGGVNHIGQVWRQDGTVYEDLVVLDGAMIPTSLGINPALTIATLADWALPQLMKAWGLKPPDQPSAPLPRQRAIWQTPQFTPPAHSTGWITERLRGRAPDGLHGIELTLRFKEVDLYQLSRGAPRKTLDVDPAHSELRIVQLGQPIAGVPPLNDRIESGEHPDPRNDWHSSNTVFRAQLNGHLDFFHREATTPCERRHNALGAWVLNRGLSDSTKALIDAVRSWLGKPVAGSTPSKGPGVWARIKDAWHLASRAGEVRRFDYVLTLGTITQSNWPAKWGVAPQTGQPVLGHKRLTYDRRCNPLKQLSRIELSALAGLHLPENQPCWLELDLSYLAQQGVPLMRLAKQEDMPTALLDMASLLLWMLRVTVNVHVWSLRKPDAPRQQLPHRSAQDTASFGQPVRHVVPVGDPRFNAPDGSQADDPRAVIELIRFQSQAAPTASRPPILLIHGYSTSSSTFAHAANHNGLAGHLWRKGFDVWIVDLRTSSARPQVATHPWSFEDIAQYDIPAAVDHILNETQQAQLDVFAHCMGSAMLWMSLLNETPWLASTKIRRLCMSQVAPVMYLSPGNVFRSFLVRYAQHLLPMGAYHFRRGEDKPNEPPALVDELLDRLLAALPYPRHEFDIENPWCPPWRRTSWVGSRHRMDALYGHDMNIRNLSADTLNAIDDLFGPLNLTTIGQVIHFARHHVPTTRSGESRYVVRNRLIKAITFPMMSIHGQENGLSDISGMYALAELLRAWDPTGRISYKTVAIPGHGHQDCLLGKDAPEAVFSKVAAFFQ